MKLMTEEIKKELLKYGIDGQEDDGIHSVVIVKYFNPYGLGTWLITGGEEMDNGDWLLYGFVSVMYNEWGYVLLSDLESVKVNGCKIIERDRYVKPGTTVAEECDRLGIHV